MKMKKLFSTRRRIAGTVMAGALLAGAGGVAFAYIGSGGNGSGNGSVQSQSLTVGTVSATIAKVTTPTQVHFHVYNSHTYSVDVHTKATVTKVTQTSGSGTCFKTSGTGTTLLNNSSLAGKGVTTTAATTALGTIGSHHTVTAGAAYAPTITLHTTSTTTQSGCTFSITIHV